MKKILCLLLIIFVSMTFSNAKIKGSVNDCTIAMDLESERIIYSNNSLQIKLPASITKILTAIIAIENGDLNDFYTVDNNTINQIGSSIYMDLNDKMRLYDLLHGLLLRSGNDCAYLISISVFNDYDKFIETMNLYCKKLKMTRSVFNNPSGLDYQENSKNNYTCCYDMAILTKYCYQNEIFKEIASKKEYSFKSSKNKMFYLYNKHRLIQNNKYAVLGKTGYTERAYRSLITVFKKDDKCLIVVTIDHYNDWNTHTACMNTYIDEYKIYEIMSRGIINLNNYFLNYNYTPIIYKDIKYPLKQNEELDINIFLFTKDNNGKIGYINIKVFQNNEVIYIDEITIYRYY